jgi:hypothetical protein
VTGARPSALTPEYPFAAMIWASDRDRRLVQVMASVWESILRVPLLPRAERAARSHWSAELPTIGVGPMELGLKKCRTALLSTAQPGADRDGCPSVPAECAGIMRQRATGLRVWR